MMGEPASVPREALAQPRRRYCSGARRKKAERTREALVDATVALISAGDFRPEAAAIAKRAGVHKSAVNRHFSAIHLLHRVIARERPGAVLEALGIEAPLSECGSDARTAGLQSDLVWIVMTGARRAA
jgi:hypothetical protein